MTKIINLGTSAFYELQEATKKAKISFDGFETAISKVFPKQAKKEKSIKDKISELNVEICEVLFEEGLICNGCNLEGTHCEGSNCGSQMDDFFSYRTKDEIQKICFKAIGDKFYNLSRKIKNELRK